MANAIKWEQAWVSRGTVLGTELNALANNARTNAGTEVANQTNLDEFGQVVLTVTFGSSPAVGAHVNLYMLTAPDGSNYSDGSSAVQPGSQTLVETIEVRASTAAQRLESRVFRLNPAKTKFLLENKTGQAFPASGSVLTLFSNNEELQ